MQLTRLYYILKRYFRLHVYCTFDTKLCYPMIRVLLRISFEHLDLISIIFYVHIYTATDFQLKKSLFSITISCDYIIEKHSGTEKP